MNELLRPLPVLAGLADYRARAELLLTAHRSAEPAAIAAFHEHHPRFLDPIVKWKPLPLDDAAIAAAALDCADAQLTVARAHGFRDWDALALHVAAVTTAGSPVQRFECAVENVVDGDLAALAAALRADPGLARARSARITCHDPPVHGATLLHYLGANGVENHRQRSPANAVAIGELLLRNGAEVDALAGMYGGRCATLSMLVSSGPPVAAGVQVPLIHLLLDHGAAIEGCGTGGCVSPLRTALAFGFAAAAAALVARGAAVADAAVAAGLGRADALRVWLPVASAAQRHEALVLAAMAGHAECVRILLAAGENPDRYNPEGLHAHATPLHQAALAGHAAVVRLLIDGGSRLDRRDRLWDSTPLGWAEHAGQRELAALLRAQGAR